MVTSKQQRRAAKKQRAAQARKHFAASPSSVSSSSGQRAFSVAELIDAAWRAAAAGPDFAVQFETCIDMLVDVEGMADAQGSVDPAHRTDAHLDVLLIGSVTKLWEDGWQPPDLVHVVRREHTPRATRLISFLIRAETGRSNLFHDMPDEWAEQLSTLGETLSEKQLARPIAAWQATERLHLPDLLSDALRVLGTLRGLPRIQPLGDPPSRWATARLRSQPRPSGAGSGEQASTKTMATIRALLAKAEGTTFPAEAEAFAAKAQELMTRYSIDAALLDGRHGDDLAAGVRSRRLHLDNPYAKEKVHLLATVAAVNGVQVVYTEAFGFATAVGFPADLDVTDMLFTSLLVQAARALIEAAAVIGRGSSPAFRRGFWIAYSVRIGERLKDAKKQASTEAETTYGTSLVPVMTERSEAVKSVTDQIFTRTKPMKSRSVDSQGWYAGRAAADLASLGSTREHLNNCAQGGRERWSAGGFL
jgi:Protein of unknown function (DUF2786)